MLGLTIIRTFERKNWCCDKCWKNNNQFLYSGNPGGPSQTKNLWCSCSFWWEEWGPVVRLEVRSQMDSELLSHLCSIQCFVWANHWCGWWEPQHRLGERSSLNRKLSTTWLRWVKEVEKSGKTFFIVIVQCMASHVVTSSQEYWSLLLYICFNIYSPLKGENYYEDKKEEWNWICYCVQLNWW